jgi:hypothetical protein
MKILGFKSYSSHVVESQAIVVLAELHKLSGTSSWGWEYQHIYTAKLL